MEQKWIGSPGTARSRREAELFVHLKLETAQAAPWLAEDDVAQAAETALTARANLQRCRLMAFGRAPDHLHLLLCFPASLPLTDLVRLMRDVSAQAITKSLRLDGGAVVLPERVWGRRYGLKTFSGPDLAGLVEYVRQHPLPHVRDQARPEWEGAEAEMAAGPRCGFRFHEAPAPFPATNET